MLRCEALEQDGLGMGCVLVLVDEEMLVLRRHRLDDGGVAKQPCCLGEERAVVDEGTVAKRLVVSIEERREAPPVGTGDRHVLEVGGSDELLAASKDEVGNLVGERAGREQRSERR